MDAKISILMDVKEEKKRKLTKKITSQESNRVHWFTMRKFSHCARATMFKQGLFKQVYKIFGMEKYWRKLLFHYSESALTSTEVRTHSDLKKRSLLQPGWQGSLPKWENFLFCGWERIFALCVGKRLIVKTISLYISDYYCRIYIVSNWTKCQLLICV